MTELELKPQPKDLSMGETSIQEFLFILAILLISGSFAGILAGLLGVGGGIIVVPVLFNVFAFLGIEDSIRMHLAIGTSLATIIPTGFRSMRAHQSQGSFDKEIFWEWLPLIALGVLIGNWIASIANTFALTLLFGIVALLVSAQISFPQSDTKVINTTPASIIKWIMAGSIGMVSSMMGIGGGTLSIPALGFFGLPIHRAIGTSAGFGFIIALTGSLGFIINGWGNPDLPLYSIGYINWLALLSITPTTIFFVPVGANFSHKLSPQTLRRLFAFFLAITAIKMLLDAQTLLQ